jgi:methylenetetrahydrofolate dehydrogenase (NADP+) / methenyltetrahydrofolate cyclohydrolase
MLILDGKKNSNKIADELKEKVLKLNFKPTITVVQVGNEADSNLYIKRKKDFGEKIGVGVDLKKFEENISSENLIKEIENLNKNEKVNGIVVQLPLPNNIDQSQIINSISPQKDIDGMTDQNISRFFKNQKPFVIPAVARAIMNLMKEYNIRISGRKFCVIGNSLYVGKSIEANFINNGGIKIPCNGFDENLASITRNVDILVSAVGKPGFINEDYVNQNQTVIDVGINFDENGKVCGDVKLKEENEVYAITPVPGGVGPMTVASLFQNLIEKI